MKRWLAHPLTRGLSLDDPRTTTLRRQIIREKPFLEQVYREWYSHIAAALPIGEGPVLELGSGAGFLGNSVPGLISSDICPCPGINTVVDGLRLPFADGSLRAIVLIDVLHHLSDPRKFFRDVACCVRPEGRIVMIEPWVTGWSRLVYGHLHHEPFRPQAEEWGFPSSGPLSGANSALPWILFERDRDRFEQEFPQWEVREIQLIMPFRYLVSGGVSLRSLMPGWSFGLWRALEKVLLPWMDQWAMFALVTLVMIGGTTYEPREVS